MVLDLIQEEVSHMQVGEEGGGWVHKNVIFGADLSRSTHANDKTRRILVLGNDFIQGKDNTTIYAEKMYSTNLIKLFV